MNTAIATTCSAFPWLEQPAPVNRGFKEIRHWISTTLSPDIVWNQDMSREIDRLTIEVERLREERC